jgi:puromycin-sensitive aminopeptidase
MRGSPMKVTLQYANLWSTQIPQKLRPNFKDMTEQSSVLTESTDKFRLPKDVIPERYEIKLTPEIDAARFTGEETITINVYGPRQRLVLNSIELVVSEAVLRGENGREYPAGIEYLPEDERLCLNFDNQIDSGKYFLHLKFAGILNDKLHGFYRSKYIDASGTEKYIATSQLEATDARRAFPCWDEPEFKAVFSISLVVDQSLVAISNAGVEFEREQPGNKKLVQFKDTMKMSTYLVAFIVGPFAGTEPRIVNGTPIRIFALPQKLELARFAIGIATHSISFFEDYYGVKYPGDKLDLIAIPDFAYGAMENLGAVTFRETALLVDEETASHAELERVADVVAHEIAHMWFGDLTTMKWWNGIWLNEAFATFMEMIAVDSWKPEWKRWESFGVSRTQALATDGLRSTRSIEFPVGKPEEANAMFDILTYEKGASVLRMLEQYIGPKVFQKGVRLYLNRFQFANTETEDLWAALRDVSEEPVGEIMKPWIFGQGHPLVKVEALTRRRYRISQQRFFYLRNAVIAGVPPVVTGFDQKSGRVSGTNEVVQIESTRPGTAGILPAVAAHYPGNASVSPASENSLFQVPLLIKARVGAEVIEKKLLLKTRSEEIEFPGDVAWLLANSGGHGFYRVFYSEFDNLARREVAGELATIERFNLVSDSWALTQAGDMPLKQYFQVIRLFAEERDKNIWTIIANSLKYLSRLIDQSQKEHLEQFLQQLLRPIVKQVGWPEAGIGTAGDAELDQVRAQLIEVLGTFGNDRGVLERARAHLNEYMADKLKINPELVPSIISIVGYNGDQSTYDHYVEVFKQTFVPQEQDRYMYALANFQSDDLLRRTLTMALDGTVRSQNAPFLVRAVMLNPAGRALAWQFVKTNWDRMPEIYPVQLIVRMLEGITGLVSRAWVADCQDFFRTRQVATGRKTLEQYLEKQQVALAMKERESATLSGPWL